MLNLRLLVRVRLWKNVSGMCSRFSGLLLLCCLVSLDVSSLLVDFEDLILDMQVTFGSSLFRRRLFLLLLLVECCLGLLLLLLFSDVSSPSDNEISRLSDLSITELNDRII